MQNKYNCEHCHYSTDRKSSYDDHKLSKKHKLKEIYSKDSTGCIYCLKTLSCKKSLKRHMIKCRSGKEELPLMRHDLMTAKLKITDLEIEIERNIQLIKQIYDSVDVDIDHILCNYPDIQSKLLKIVDVNRIAMLELIEENEQNKKINKVM